MIYEEVKYDFVSAPTLAELTKALNKVYHGLDGTYHLEELNIFCDTFTENYVAVFRRCKVF